MRKPSSLKVKNAGKMTRSRSMGQLSSNKPQLQTTRKSNGQVSNSFVRRDGRVLYGLDAELAHKIEGKRDKAFEKKVLIWLAEALDRGENSESPLFDWMKSNEDDKTKENIPTNDDEDDEEEKLLIDFETDVAPPANETTEENEIDIMESCHDVLRSGVILIELLNKTKLCKNHIKHNVQDHDLAYVENIRLYLNSLVVFNIPSDCIFNPEDLLRAADLGGFLNALACFARFLDTKSIEGIPIFEPATLARNRSNSTKSVRHWEVDTSSSLKLPGSVSMDNIANHMTFTKLDGTEVFGMDAELAMKNEAKRDKIGEQKILKWFNEVTNQTVTSENIIDKLKDGFLLADLLCGLKNTTGCGYKLNTFKNVLAYRQNISNYLSTCQESFGLSKEDCCEPQDFESGNVVHITDHLMALALVVQKRKGYTGPRFTRMARSISYNLINDAIVSPKNSNDDTMSFTSGSSSSAIGGLIIKYNTESEDAKLMSLGDGDEEDLKFQEVAGWKNALFGWCLCGFKF